MEDNRILPVFTSAYKRRLKQSAKFFRWNERRCLDNLVKMIEELDLYGLSCLDNDCYEFTELNVWHWEGRSHGVAWVAPNEIIVRPTDIEN